LAASNEVEKQKWVAAAMGVSRCVAKGVAV
jgi:hypothetical protein